MKIIISSRVLLLISSFFLYSTLALADNIAPFVQMCEGCHRQDGAEPMESAAILAGQWTFYLRRQLKNITSGKRLVPRSMLRRVRDLPEEDIEALLSFYAMQGDQQP